MKTLLDDFVADFQLTTSRRGRQHNGAEAYIYATFQLTTSRRGRPAGHLLSVRQRPFNSRPHAEVDCDMPLSRLRFTAFQLTTSRRGRLRLCRHGFCQTSFNSRPHAEVDSEGSVQYYALSLSTHDLTQRSTVYAVQAGAFKNLSTHDLTQRSTGHVTRRLRAT